LDAELKGHKCSIYRSCYLCGTRRLRSIANDSPDIPKCINDCQGNLLIGSSIHICDTCTGTTGCADCTTIRRKTSNVIFLMDCDQIADNQRATKLLVRYFPLIRKYNNRKRNGHSLVSTSRIDNNRHRTTTHTSIASGCCPCTGSCSNTLSPYMHQSFTNLCSIVIIKTLLCNC